MSGLNFTTRLVNAGEARVALGKMSDDVRAGVKAEVFKAAQQAEAIIRANVTGGVLNARPDGKLASSIKTTFIETEKRVFAKVGSDYYVSRFWEFGFNGQQTVRAHLRKIKSGEGFSLLRRLKSGRVKVDARFQSGGATVVKAHTRVTDGAARPFVNPAIRAVIPGFTSGLAQVVKSATGQ